MGGKTAIVLGLVAGVVVGGLLVGGIVALTPGPGSPAPAPSVPASSAPDDTPSQIPSGSPSMPAVTAPASPEPSPTSLGEAFGIGEPAPPLVLPLLGGGTVDLAAYRGKPVWVNFMATWCPSCVDELPLMAGYAARYADPGLRRTARGRARGRGGRGGVLR